MCHLQVIELIAVLYCEAVDYVFASAVCMHDKNRELSYIMLKYFLKGMSLQTTRSTNFRRVMKSTPVAYEHAAPSPPGLHYALLSVRLSCAINLSKLESSNLVRRLRLS